MTPDEVARRLLPERSTALIATLLFALTPRAFNWEIVGGGLTRSPGLLFAMLALWQGYQMYRTPARRYVVSTALLGDYTNKDISREHHLSRA